ncbi:MAG: hypothetical protein ACE5I7_15990 [Candidatus Binatia bacterium]
MQHDHRPLLSVFWSNTYWRVSTIVLLLGLVVLVLELFGVLRELGVVLAIVGMWISMYFGLAGAEERSVELLQSMLRGIDSRLESIDGQLDGQTRVLVDIRDLLRER